MCVICRGPSPPTPSRVTGCWATVTTRAARHLAGIPLIRRPIVVRIFPFPVPNKPDSLLVVPGIVRAMSRLTICGVIIRDWACLYQRSVKS